MRRKDVDKKAQRCMSSQLFFFVMKRLHSHFDAQFFRRLTRLGAFTFCLFFHVSPGLPVFVVLLGALSPAMVVINPDN
jgi:hypothetical protein